METRFVEDLERLCGGTWTALRKSRTETDTLLERVRRDLAASSSFDTSVVVTGSVGRGEVTRGSDFDWMLLVDGASNPDHYKLTRTIADALKALGLKPPGREQIFGELVSSHELVHHIAGREIRTRI